MVMAGNSDNRRKSNILLTSVLLIAIFIFGMLVLGRYSQMAEMNLKINLYNRELAELKSQNGNLFVEMTRLRSVDRIETIAKNKLGMEKAPNYTYVFVTSKEKESENEIIVDQEPKNPLTGIFSIIFNFLSRSVIWQDN